MKKLKIKNTEYKIDSRGILRVHMLMNEELKEQIIQNLTSTDLNFSKAQEHLQKSIKKRGENAP